MMRSTSALVLLVCGGLALSACGNKSETGGTTGAASAAPVQAASAAPVASAEPAASASAAPADTAAAAPSGSASAAPADTGSAPPPVAGVPVQPIDSCCAALSAVGHSGRGRKAKNKASRAAEICPGIAALVRQGRSTRQAALTQIKSALVGSTVPPECAH
jgi:hypothetical protein